MKNVSKFKKEFNSKVYAITAKQGITTKSNIYIQSDSEDDAINEAKRMIESGECIIGNSKFDFKILSARILEDGIAKRKFLKQLTSKDKQFIKEREEDYLQDAMGEHYSGTGHPFEN